MGAPVSGLVPTTSLSCKDESLGTVITVAILFSPPFSLNVIEGIGLRVLPATNLPLYLYKSKKEVILQGSFKKIKNILIF
jgi:hypothetical protein